MEKPPLKQLSSQEWESLIDDFQCGRHEKWLSQYSSPLSLLDLGLLSILRKDFPLKLTLLIFLEESSSFLIPESHIESGLSKLIETLRVVIQAPVDQISVTYSLKEQMMVSTTTIVISVDGLRNGIRHLESLTELLLTIINRPNHGLDRQTRGIACECLRELENAFPCLLVEVSGHLWNLCQSERTHAFQSYILLLTSVIHDIVMSKINGLFLATSVPLVPFNVPQLLLSDSDSSDFSGSNSKELRRVLAFLLERPQILTPCAMMEFMSMIIRVATALELQASLLKVQFSGLLYSYDPMLCHIVLMLYSHFSDAFDDQEDEIARRLMLISREVQHHLIFRLLALHWLLGFIGVPSLKGDLVKKNSVACMSSSFYPSVFDPLALKSVKLDLLAYCAWCLNAPGSERAGCVLAEDVGSGVSVVKQFKDGLVSVSAFKWLPPWSTETAVAFRTFHKFLIGATPHSTCNESTLGTLMESNVFHNLQRMLVDLVLEFQRLVPIIVAFTDRLLACHSHRWLGERLLQTFDEHLLPKLSTDYRLAPYFPIFDRIVKNDTIPPRGLLELLTQFVIVLVEKHGPDTGLKSWSHGNKVLGICRTMLTHHHSSRVFLVLSRLLAFACLYFPDLEVRDNARIYLRMLVCIPGKKLRHLLNFEEQLPGISQSQDFSTLFNAQSWPSQDIKKSRNISSYIHFERVIPLLVKQSWSLSICTLGIGSKEAGYFEGMRYSEPPADIGSDAEGRCNVEVHVETDKSDLKQEPLRVMDSKVSEILGILRRHFLCIPDFRHMVGLKIRIACTLRFESEPFNNVWGVHSRAMNLNGGDALPAIYAVVVTFSSSASYGSIPSCRIPFLLGEPVRNAQKGGLDMVPLDESGFEEEDGNCVACIMIELEPREPMPGLVDVTMEANAENGESIRGQLQSITIGIEDMFLKASVPLDIPEDAVPGYYSDLFNALWEACGNSSNTGRETFSLKGGKGVAAINSTRSVKLLEVSAGSLIGAIERYLAPFVVSVVGASLIRLVKDGGVIRDIIWKDGMDFDVDANSLATTGFDMRPLQLKYNDDDDDNDDQTHIGLRRRNWGCFFILIFLPPRFHLLFQMEVSETSTLVRIRTDHWPCLAYIDDYLEALFLT